MTVLTPDPAAAPDKPPLPATATLPASTIELMVIFAVADKLNAAAALIALLLIYACTATPFKSSPISLLAIAAPIDKPRPLLAPAATETATAATVDVILESFTADRTTEVAAKMLLFSMYA